MVVEGLRPPPARAGPERDPEAEATCLWGSPWPGWPPPAENEEDSAVEATRVERVLLATSETQRGPPGARATSPNAGQRDPARLQREHAPPSRLPCRELQLRLASCRQCWALSMPVDFDAVQCRYWSMSILVNVDAGQCRQLVNVARSFVEATMPARGTRIATQARAP